MPTTIPARTAWLVPLLATLACREEQARPPRAEAAQAAVAQATSDSGGLPPGYLGRLDDSAKSLRRLRYSLRPGDRLDVESGSHDQNLGHISYRPGDTASGTYTIHADIEQISTPMHPEAFGIFFGGSDLAGPAEHYTYFLVRGDGQYSAKLRSGAAASVLLPFTSSTAVAKSDDSKPVMYHIAIRVEADSLRFMVDDKRVAALPRKDLPTSGIYGLRVNHGLHVVLDPIRITRP